MVRFIENKEGSGLDVVGLGSTDGGRGTVGVLAEPVDEWFSVVVVDFLVIKYF